MQGVHRHAARGQAGEAGAGAGVVGIVIVVAHPDFEQVAQQVERFGGARRPVEKGEKRIDGPGGLAVEMQVGGETGCGAVTLTSAAVLPAAAVRHRRARLPCWFHRAAARRGGAGAAAGAGAGPRSACSVDELDLLDDHRLQRRILLERSHRAGGRDADAIDHFHAFDDLAEHGVTPARGQGIEIGVVGHVHDRTGSHPSAGRWRAPGRRCRAGS